jgi:hypothetical protein
MRAPGLLSVSFAALTLAAPAVVRAQDPTDSVPAVEETDSTLDDGWDREDADTAEHADRMTRRRGEGNPYLREIEAEKPAPMRRGPIWVSGSLGAGGEAIALPEAASPYDRSRIAPTFSFGIGATVGQQLRLGFEGFVWFNPQGNSELESVTAGMITGRVYPFRNAGLFLKSGFGLGRYGQDVIDDCDCSAVITEDYGFAWLVGGGFEAPVTRGLWIGPTVEMLRMNVSGPDGYRERVINVGLSITFDGKN